MPEFLQVWSTGASSIVPLDGDTLTIGRADTSDVCLAQDPTVSRAHAIVQRYGNLWCVRDVGSSNGTLVNGRRIAGEHRLSAGDEITVGDSRAVFRSTAVDDRTETLTSSGPPLLTRREKDVLVALCRPMLSDEPFSQPATVRQMAAEFTVSTEAVKFHLRNLYDKFRIYGPDPSKRTALANAAVKSGAVSRADLLSGSGTDVSPGIGSAGDG